MHAFKLNSCKSGQNGRIKWLRRQLFKYSYNDVRKTDRNVIETGTKWSASYYTQVLQVSRLNLGLTGRIMRIWYMVSVKLHSLWK